MQASGKRRALLAALRASGFERLRFAAAGIDVWLVRLAAGASRIHNLHATLSTDEKKRASRLRAASDRRKFIVARGMLRLLLGLYLDTPPADLQFAYGRHGKPRLKPATALHFNTAHTGERAVYAISLGAPTGVDIEYFRRKINFAPVAKRFFSPAEYLELMQLPPSRRLTGFYDFWTCKEAVIKATGRGLAQGLERFTVSFTGIDAPRLSSAESSTLCKMRLYATSTAGGYTIALAALPRRIQSGRRQRKIPTR